VANDNGGSYDRTRESWGLRHQGCRKESRKDKPSFAKKSVHDICKNGKKEKEKSRNAQQRLGCGRVYERKKGRRVTVKHPSGEGRNLQKTRLIACAVSGTVMGISQRHLGTANRDV